MSTANLLNTCQACGAQESLDSLLLRLIDDDEARSLIADVLTMSLPLGGSVVRYLRLHTPAKQRLRMSTVSKVLAELVPDMQRATFERNGRVWAASPDAWRAAFQGVFDAQARGALITPLVGNGYLYGVLIRAIERQVAAAEEASEQSRRHRAPAPVASSVDELAAEGMSPTAIGDQIAKDAGAAADPEAAARAATIRNRLKAELEAKRAKVDPEAQP